jgi:hypothetical protein
MVPAVHAGSPATDLSHGRRAWELAQSNPAELMRQTTQNEIANSYGHRPSLRYQLRKTTAKSNLTKEIVETPDGGVARLTAIDGHPLSPSQERLEIDRLRVLDANPTIEAHRHRNETQDAERIRKFMRLLPEAFLYRYAGQTETANGEVIRLSFEPNPRFSPPDFESRILTGIRGEVWIDPEEMRAVRMEGRIFKTVDFGWGILGTLYPGGTLLLQESKTAACGWQMAHLNLHLEGKELLFKSLHITVEETATDYHPVPAEWKYRDAIRWLLQMTSVPAPQITRE